LKMRRSINGRSLYNMIIKIKQNLNKEQGLFE
jgi:hypothetical protein